MLAAPAAGADADQSVAAVRNLTTSAGGIIIDGAARRHSFEHRQSLTATQLLLHRFHRHRPVQVDLFKMLKEQSKRIAGQTVISLPSAIICG